MATEVQSGPSLTDLVKGIVNDIGDLIRQEVRFARTEIKSDLRKTRSAVVILFSGLSIAAVGGLLLSLMLVYLLHWSCAPAGSDPSGLPLWACFGILALLFLGIGSALAWMGLKRFDTFNPLPDETAKTLEENVSWIANQSSK